MEKSVSDVYEDMMQSQQIEGTLVSVAPAVLLLHAYFCVGLHSTLQHDFEESLGCL